jgi:hypothetical protein
VFELAPTKLPHYTLPSYPAIALICGAGVVMALNERWRITHAIGLAVFALAGAGMVAAWSVGAAFASTESGAATASALPAALAGALVLMGAVTVLGLARSLPTRLAAGVVCALVLSFGFRQIILPSAHGLFPSAEAAQALGANGLAARPLWVLGYRETSLVFLTRTDAHLTYAEDVAAHAAAGDAVVVSQDKLPALQGLLRPRGLLFAQGRNAGEVHGLNLGNGHRVTLYVGLIAPN